MEIDKKMLEKAANLPEEQLSSLIYSVIIAVGGSKMQARTAASNTGKLKKKFETVTNDELLEIINSVDAEKMESVMEILKKNGGMNGG